MTEFTIGRLLRAITKNFEIQLKHEMADLDLDFESNFSYYQYLIIINALSGMNQNDLAKRMNVGKGSASKSVKYLIKNGLIYRVKDEKDRRHNKLFTTDKGKQIAEKFTGFFKMMNKRIVSDFTDDEKDLLRAMLKRMYKNTANDENIFMLEEMNFMDEKIKQD